MFVLGVLKTGGLVSEYESVGLIYVQFHSPKSLRRALPKNGKSIRDFVRDVYPLERQVFDQSKRT